MPETRGSDRLLIWEVYKYIGIVKEVEFFGTQEGILKQNFLSAKIPPTESITRARRKLQEKHPELQTESKEVLNQRRKKADTKGTFVFRENVDWEVFK